jgi:hypothetical protein
MFIYVHTYRRFIFAIKLDINGFKLDLFLCKYAYICVFTLQEIHFCNKIGHKWFYDINIYVYIYKFMFIYEYIYEYSSTYFYTGD